MAITRTAMVDDDGSGTTGTIINNAWKTELYNQIDGAVGVWTDFAFSAATFAAVGGTWTVAAGNQTTYAYAVSGQTMTLALYITGSTIGGTPSALTVTLPRTISRKTGEPYNFSFAGTTGVGWALADPAALNVLKLYRDILGTPLTAGTAHVTGVFAININ